MSKMSELDLERRDIEDGLRPMDMGTVFYLTHLLNAEGNRQASAIIHDLLEQHTQRYPVLYRNVANQAPPANCDTASQYSITHPKPGIAVAERCAAQGAKQGELDLSAIGNKPEDCVWGDAIPKGWTLLSDRVPGSPGTNAAIDIASAEEFKEWLRQTGASQTLLDLLAPVCAGCGGPMDLDGYDGLCGDCADHEENVKQADTMEAQRDEWEHLAESVIEGVRLTLNSSQHLSDADPNAYYALWYWVEWGMKVNTKLKLQQDENN